MRKQSVIAILMVLVFSLAASRHASAQKPPTPPPELTKEDVANELTNATKQMNDVTNHLGANAAAANKAADKWREQEKAIEKLRTDAKKEADQAKDLADQALEAAKKCDKAKYADLKMKATSHANSAKSMTKSADSKEAGLTKGMDALQNQMNDAEKASLKAETDAGNIKGGTNMAPMGGFNKAQQAYNDALDDKQTASDLRSYRITRDFIKGQLKDAKTDNDPTKALDGVKEDLDAAEKALKDCPPKEGAMAPKPTNEIYVALDTNCGTNVDLCNIKEGQDSRPVADSLGMQDCGAIATTTTDAVYHCPGSASRADTIKTRAKAKDICVGFSETNYCEGGAPFNSERSKFVNPVPIVIQLRRAVR
jgi:hypothetical protein